MASAAVVCLASFAINALRALAGCSRRERFAAADLGSEVLAAERAADLSRPLIEKLSDLRKQLLIRMEGIKVRERELGKLFGLGFCRAAGGVRALDKASVAAGRGTTPTWSPWFPVTVITLTMKLRPAASGTFDRQG